MELVAYLYGIQSDRRLCEEVRYNLAYRWFCHLSLEDDVPDHSSLSRIRDRYGEKIFESVFRETVVLCPQKGLVQEACSLRTDATLAQKKGSPRQLKYKVHQSIDADSRVILDTHVTPGARHDNQPYLDQLPRIRDRYRLTIREATADRAYGSAAMIRTLREHGAETSIPLWSGRVGNSKYFQGGLVYEQEPDRF